MSVTQPAPPSVPWQETMAKMAQRYNDSRNALEKLDALLAVGHYTANQLRRAEEDAVRTYGLYISALIESYPNNE